MPIACVNCRSRSSTVSACCRRRPSICLIVPNCAFLPIALHDQGVVLIFLAKPAVDPFPVIQLLQSTPKPYAMQGSDRLKISNKTETGEQRAMFLRALLTRLGSTTA